MFARTIAFVPVLLICLGSAASTQQKTKIGIRNHLYKAPLEVVGVKVNGQEITPGESFQADRNWIKNLSVTVKNTSDRNLIGIGASVEFPYDENDMPTLPEVEFWHGLYSLDTPQPPNDFLLHPGETHEMQLTQAAINAYQYTLDHRLSRPSLVHNVIVQPTLAVFNLTSVWNRGTYTKRAEPGKGGWQVDKGIMEKVSQQIRNYKKNEFQMLKAGFSPQQERRCVCYADCNVKFCGGTPPANCPDCQYCEHVVQLDPTGNREKNITVTCVFKQAGQPDQPCPDCTRTFTTPNYQMQC